jgi:hypothetical protein
MFISLMRIIRWLVYRPRLYWKNTKKPSLTNGCADATQQRGCIYGRVSCWIALMGIQVKTLLSDTVQASKRLPNGGADLRVTDLPGCQMRHIEPPTQEGHALECAQLVRGYGFAARFRTSCLALKSEKMDALARSLATTREQKSQGNYCPIDTEWLIGAPLYWA